MIRPTSRSARSSSAARLRPFAQPLPFGTRDGAYEGWFQTEHYADQIRLSWAMNGFGVMIALEEPDDNVFESQYWGYGSAMPDVVAALTWSNDMVEGKLSFVYSEGLSDWADYYGYEGGWAVSAGVVVKLDSLAPGDKLLLKAAYGDSAAPYVTGKLNWGYGSMWSAMGSFTHFFAPNFSTTSRSTTLTRNRGAAARGRGRSTSPISPAPTLWITPEVNWSSWNGDDNWWLRLRVPKVFY